MPGAKWKAPADGCYKEDAGCKIIFGDFFSYIILTAYIVDIQLVSLLFMINKSVMF